MAGTPVATPTGLPAALEIDTSATSTPLASRGGATACPDSARPPPVRPLILCGPSGSGKSTLIAKLQAEFGDAFGFSVSHTTRDPRPGEVDGKDYHFVTREKFMELRDARAFLESATVHGNSYGTSKAAVHAVADTGKICILDIDIQGVRSVKSVGFGAMFIFLRPPSLEVLEARLRGRGTETEDRLQRRLATARTEIAESAELEWDAVIVNDELERAYEQLREATASLRAAVRRHRDHIAAFGGYTPTGDAAATPVGAEAGAAGAPVARAGSAFDTDAAPSTGSGAAGAGGGLRGMVASAAT